MSSQDDQGAGSTEAVPGASAQDVGTAEPAAPALREDQIQNAIAFLTHPKVQGSPQATKRSFLERKGLTAAEIEEAFKRVPEPVASATPSTSTAAISSTPQQGPNGLVTYRPAQQQTQQQQPPYLQQSASNAIQPYAPAAQQAVAPPQPPPPEPVRWSQVVLGIGVVAAGVYAVRNIIYPYAHDMYKSWSSSAKARQDALEQREKEIHEAVGALRDCQAELKRTSDNLSEVAVALKEQTARSSMMADYGLHSEPYASELKRELAEMRTALQRAIPSTSAPSYARPGDSRDSYNRNTYGSGYNPASFGNNGNYSGVSGSGFASPVYTSAPSTIAPPPQGYLGGGYPPSTTTDGDYNRASRGTNYNPSVPAQPSSSVFGEERRMAGGVGSDAGGSGGAGASSGSGPGSSQRGVQPKLEEPAYPQSFHEVMEMVAKGITPPNVRTDINDQPPDPNHPISESRFKPKPKPWEQAGPTSSASSVVDMPFGTPAPATLGAATSAPPGLAGGISPGGAPWAPPHYPPAASSYASALSSSSLAGGSSGSALGGGSSSSEPYQVSILQPNAAWKPPAPPQATVTRVKSNSSIASSTSGSAMAGPSTPPGPAPAPAPAAEPVVTEVPEASSSASAAIE